MNIAFLDRDGVINEDLGYVYKKENFFIRPGILKFCSFLHTNGYLISVVSNQSGIGRGYFTEKNLKKITDHMFQIFQSNSTPLSHFSYCPHHPKDLCPCRKPNPTLINQILESSNVRARNCIMVGDKYTDMLAAKRAGILCRFKVGSADRDKKGVLYEKQLLNIEKILQSTLLM